jgi:hypothetical protein
VAEKICFALNRIDQQIRKRLIEQAVGNPHQPEFSPASSGNSSILHQSLTVS